MSRVIAERALGSGRFASAPQGLDFESMLKDAVTSSQAATATPTEAQLASPAHPVTTSPSSNSFSDGHVSGTSAAVDAAHAGAPRVASVTSGAGQTEPVPSVASGATPAEAPRTTCNDGFFDGNKNPVIPGVATNLQPGVVTYSQGGPDEHGGALPGSIFTIGGAPRIGTNGQLVAGRPLTLGQNNNGQVVALFQGQWYSLNDLIMHSQNPFAYAMPDPVAAPTTPAPTS